MRTGQSGKGRPAAPDKNGVAGGGGGLADTSKEPVWAHDFRFEAKVAIDLSMGGGSGIPELATTLDASFISCFGSPPIKYVLLRNVRLELGKIGELVRPTADKVWEFVGPVDENVLKHFRCAAPPPVFGP